MRAVTLNCSYTFFLLKMDFRSKSNFRYLYNYALVEDIDNWTRSYILIIIY